MKSWAFYLSHDGQLVSARLLMISELDVVTIFEFPHAPWKFVLLKYGISLRYSAPHKYCTQSQNKNGPYFSKYGELRNKLGTVEKVSPYPTQRCQVCFLINHIQRDMDYFGFGSAYNTYVEQSTSKKEQEGRWGTLRWA